MKQTNNPHRPSERHDDHPEEGVAQEQKPACETTRDLSSAVNAADLRECWDIGAESFRTLLEVDGRSRPRRKAGEPTQFSASETMPGDDELSAPDFVGSWRVDIAAPVQQAWAWLAQVMRGGGMYGWPALESVRCRSAGELLDGLAPPRVGDRLGDLIEVIAVEPERSIVWRARRPIRVVRSVIDDLTLSYRLTANGPARTRLDGRIRFRCCITTVRISMHLGQSIERILLIHQLRAVRNGAESLAGKRAPRAGVAPSKGPICSHQRLSFVPAGTSDRHRNGTG